MLEGEAGFGSHNHSAFATYTYSEPSPFDNYSFSVYLHNLLPSMWEYIASVPSSYFR